MLQIQLNILAFEPFVMKPFLSPIKNEIDIFFIHLFCTTNTGLVSVRPSVSAIRVELSRKSFYAIASYNSSCQTSTWITDFSSRLCHKHSFSSLTMIRLVLLCLVASQATAFSVTTGTSRHAVSLYSTTAIEEPVDGATGSMVDETPDIPTNLPSEKGMDYVPLATMLATGQFQEADQFTRDALIELAGSKQAGRNFVYFTEVKNIPATDLATMERLWNQFSGGKFGYSVQKVRAEV
jgi:hypothetical protein